MKKNRKINGLAVLSFLSFINVCFADVIFPGESAKGHGVQYYHDPQPNISRYIGIGILVLTIAICAIIIIKRTIKNKKEKSNDNK